MEVDKQSVVTDEYDEMPDADSKKGLRLGDDCNQEFLLSATYKTALLYSNTCEINTKVCV